MSVRVMLRGRRVRRLRHSVILRCGSSCEVVVPLWVKFGRDTDQYECEVLAKFCFRDRIAVMSSITQPGCQASKSVDDEEVDALTIGRRIRQLRTARGMTLDELAAAVDRAPSQLSMIETGKREPKLTLLQAIARALGVDARRAARGRAAGRARARSRSRSSARCAGRPSRRSASSPSASARRMPTEALAGDARAAGRDRPPRATSGRRRRKRPGARTSSSGT